MLYAIFVASLNVTYGCSFVCVVLRYVLMLVGTNATGAKT